MDNKKHTVDDILLDIKSKKSRQKDRNSVARARTEPVEDFPSARREASPFAQAPVSAPVAESPVNPEPVRETPVRNPPEPAAAEKTPEPAIAERATGAFEPPVVRETPVRKSKAKKPPEPAAAERAAEPFEPPAVKEKKPNPMRFEGHVQSIADRAKMRQRYGRFSQPGPEPPAPEPEARQDDTIVIDFSSFRAGVMDASDAQEEDLQGTRMLPKLGVSRDRGLDELRSLRPAVLGVDDGFEEPEDYGDDDEDEDDYEDDYEDDGLHKPAVDFSEYNSVEDRRDVAIDIARVKLWLFIRLTLTALLSSVLSYLVLSGRYMALSLPVFIAPEVDLRAYLMSLTVVSVLVALAGSSAMGGGLIAFFKMRSNSDTLPALAMLGAVGQCVFATARPELVNPEQLTLYCCVAAVGMFFNALGKMSLISRIQANFKIISDQRSKKAVLLVDDESFCRHFVKGSVRRPAVAASAKADFFTDFLALSYSDKYDVGINKVVAPICLSGAVVVCILAYILTKGDTMSAVTALTAILCVSSTFSATFLENVPLGKLTKKLAPKGGMVSGNKAVEDFCDVSAVVLSETDLFPAGHIQVHGIRPFENGRVDEAILDAASVFYAAGSAMSGVFLEMVGGNKKLLRPVEGIACENGRGISAWVASRRVLIGNRKLMQAYGVDLPEQGMDAKYAQDGNELLYLAAGGEACARFLVSYRIDDDLAVELDRLSAMEKILIVYTIDPNLDAHKIWSLYSYPEKLVRIVPAELHGRYKELTQPRPEAMAEIAYTGRASAMAGAILACIQARSSILAATVAQLLQIALGYGFIALLAFLGSMDTVTVLALSAYQAFWFVVISLIQKLRPA